MYLVAGHGGAGVSRDGTPPLMYAIEAANGSVILDVEGRTLTARNIRMDGVVTDEFTLIKREGLFLSEPSGGEAILAGSATDVTWTSIGGSCRVHVDYTIDGGAAWYRAAESTIDDGHFASTTPSVLTDDAWVRITDAADPSRSDRSSTAFSLVDIGEFEVVPWGSDWEFHDAGHDQGSDWRTTLGAWLSGPAELGYGNGDEATVLRDEDPNIPTVYFRRGFDLDGDVEGATLRVVYDDGIAVWLNGVELDRRNIDDVSFDAWASSGSSDNTLEELAVVLDAFHAGENIIAAIVKQRSAGSSDLSFDLRLTVRQRVPVSGDPPRDPLVGADPEDDVGLIDAGAEVHDDASPDAPDDDVVPDTSPDEPDDDTDEDANVDPHDGAIEVDGSSSDASIPDGATPADTTTGVDARRSGAGCAIGGARNTPPGIVLLVAMVALLARRRCRHNPGRGFA